MIFSATLNSMRRSDFSRGINHTYSYVDMEVIIERDFLNDRWLYSSHTHSVSGVFYGSVEELKKKIKYEYSQLNK